MGQYARNYFFVLLSLVLLVSLSCSSPKAAETNSPIEITDQLGRVVKLDTIPQRIISLAPSNTEILFALGLGDKVVGVTPYDDFPAEAKQKESVGGYSTPDMEKVVALKPDLIVAATIHEKKVVPELERRNIPVVVLSPQNMSEIMQGIMLLGKLTGTDGEARKLVNNMQARINKVSKLTQGLSPEKRPRVFYVLWHDPLRTTGKDTFHDELISLAGGVNIFNDVDRYNLVNLEVVLERNPQIILADTGHGSGSDAPYLWATQESRLNGTEARKRNQVFKIDADIVDRAGPRIVDGLEAMLRLINPELSGKL
ncbi:MAG: ABC transporter substrate-binding protein [Chloroflexi bacterium]|nr:ABC transporter substrate-binding protein [Chloroflexota bacterium]